jgi:hypothetical protein
MISLWSDHESEKREADRQARPKKAAWGNEARSNRSQHTTSFSIGHHVRAPAKPVRSAPNDYQTSASTARRFLSSKPTGASSDRRNRIRGERRSKKQKGPKSSEEEGEAVAGFWNSALDIMGNILS